MLKNKKALAMSVLCAIASVGFVVSASAAEQTMHGNLDEVVVVRRDTREKIVVSLDEIETKLGEILETIQKDMYDRAKAFLDSHIDFAETMDEMNEKFNTKRGFIKAKWCGSAEFPCRPCAGLRARTCRSRDIFRCRSPARRYSCSAHRPRHTWCAWGQRERGCPT